MSDANSPEGRPKIWVRRLQLWRSALRNQRFPSTNFLSVIAKVVAGITAICVHLRKRRLTIFNCLNPLI